MMRVVHDEPRQYGRIAVQFGLYGDRDEMQAQHSRYQFVPNHLRIEYRMSRTGVWLEDSWTLSGPRVLKNGALSQNSNHKRDGYFGRTSSDPSPDWVMEIAEKYRPGNTAPAPNASSDTTLFHAMT